MIRKSRFAGVLSLPIVLSGCLLWGQEKNKLQEQERKVEEREVPAAPMNALKKLAGSAPFTEFAEEMEHGHKYYEGSWKGSDGNVDAVVTEAGDVVVIEEIIPAEKVPAVVRAEAEKAAGKEAKLTYEKKSMILYEVHFKKGDKAQEMIFTPDGRPYQEEGEKKGEKNGNDKDDD